MESHDNHRSGPDRIVSHSEAGSHPPRMTPPLSPSVYRQFPRPSSPRLHGFAFLSPLNLASVLVSVPPRFATSRHASARLNPLPETTARSPSLNSIRTEFIRPRATFRQGSPAPSRLRRPRAFHVQTNGYSLKVVQPLQLPSRRAGPQNCLTAAASGEAARRSATAATDTIRRRITRFHHPVLSPVLADSRSEKE